MTLFIKSNNANNLPVSSFYIKTKPSVDGVSMSSGTFFQKEHLSIPLQRIILNILKNYSINIYRIKHPIFDGGRGRQGSDFRFLYLILFRTSLFRVVAIFF